MFFWNSRFFYDPLDVGNLISGSSAFSKSSLNTWKFSIHVLLKPRLEYFEHYFASIWGECNCVVVWTFFGIAFLWESLSFWASLVAQMVKRLPAMQETWVRFLGWEDPLKKEMVIHSTTLAWKIPWTEEPDKLQSMGSQRVGHDWATWLSLFFGIGLKTDLFQSCGHC